MMSSKYTPCTVPSSSLKAAYTKRGSTYCPYVVIVHGFVSA